jgi:hypothetical protein
MSNIFCFLIVLTVLLIRTRVVYQESLPLDDFEAAITILATLLLFCFVSLLECVIEKTFQKFQDKSNQD